jgi:hypothetical protein
VYWTNDAATSPAVNIIIDTTSPSAEKPWLFEPPGPQAVYMLI